MITLNYYIHLLLNSKYRFLFNLFVILIIYSVLYGNKIIFCMNDNPDIVNIPQIAETKEPVRPSEQVIALRRNIQAFADSHASLLEKIRKNAQTIDELTYDRSYLRELNLELRKQNGALGRTIHDLRERVAELDNEARDHYIAYKEQCKLNGRLGHSIGKLRQEISATNIENEALYDENSRLKAQLQVERNRVDNLRRALAEKKEILKNIK